MGVDLLRAGCILYIVCYWHLIPYTSALPGYANWLTEGLKYVALATFVLCSGFLLAGRPVGLDPRGLWSFYRRRLVRIYPLFLLAAVLFALTGIATAAQALDGALLISMFAPPALPTLWFVAMIMVFYLVAPPLIRLADRPPRAILAGALLVLLLLAWHRWVKPIDLRIAMYLPVFVLGILWRRQPGIGQYLMRYRGWSMVLALLLLPLSRIGNEWSAGGAMTIVPLLLASAGALLLYADGVARRLHGPTIAFLAYASFGFYLFHRLVFQAAIALWYPAQGWDQVIYLLAVAVPLSLLLGYGVQRGYDRLTAGTRHPAGQGARPPG